MTRFARAKGSKASNEKVPHEATSWTVMKQELHKSQEEGKNKEKREEFNKERQENYNQFLQQSEKPQHKRWTDFPETNLKSIKKKKNALKNITEKDVTDEMIDNLCYSDPEVDEELKTLTEKADEVIAQQKRNKPLKKQATNLPQDEDSSDEPPEESSTKVEPKKIQIKKSKMKKQALKIASVDANTKTTKKFDNKNVEQKKEKIKKPRRKPIPVETVTVNGKDEPVMRYFGFPVLKSDHDRLVDLRKSLVSKGIPHSEIQHTMKLERRKAEKHLSRIKKTVCYKCRGSGHMLSSCPLIENSSQTLIDNSATGLCFKCGSTEHSSKECKVSNNFKFAKCFICREQGHIASQCPDNPRGLYPKGGACKLCGDVTHLKKDCPKYQEQVKNNEVFLNTISNGNIEAIADTVQNNTKKHKIHKKKVVKF